MTALACVALGCGENDKSSGAGGGNKNGDPIGVGVDLETCPVLDAERIAVVFDEERLRAASPDTPTLSVWLRDPAFPSVPACDGAGADDRIATCEQRDEALERRLATSSKEFECVLIDGLNLTDPSHLARALLENIKPTDWEEPYHFSDGTPVPVLRAFRTGLTWTLVEQLSRHPYVERIDAVPGDAPFLGALAPPAPGDCPREREDPAPKLADAATLQGAGRKPVVIHMSLLGIPNQVACAAGLDAAQPASCAELCDAFFFAEWDRYMLSTRRLACLGRELDAVVGSGEYRVDYDGRQGSPCTPTLLGAAPTVVTDIARVLTREEAERVAAHPYVAAIFPFDPGIDPDMPGDCPLDVSAPVPVPECTDERDTAMSKWTPENEEAWRASTEPNEVVIVVSGGAKSCPAPNCPPLPNPCPEFERQNEYMAEWNQESQRCVRDLIAESGGDATDERFWLVNALIARLTWDQIQIVSAHPHVQSIEPNDTGTPPP